MGTSSWLATWLDWDRITSIAGTPIVDVSDPSRVPQRRTGREIAEELGGRKLLRYLTPTQVGRFTRGTTELCYTTPTPYSPEETLGWLMLPAPTVPRTHVLILEPAAIRLIEGPMWVAPARGIQYILPEGFPASAIIVPGAAGVQWEIAVT